VTWLAIDLCPLVLRREGNLEIFQEGYDGNLHLKDAIDGFSSSCAWEVELWDGTDANRQPMHARVPLAMDIVSEETKQYPSFQYLQKFILHIS